MTAREVQEQYARNIILNAAKFFEVDLEELSLTGRNNRRNGIALWARVTICIKMWTEGFSVNEIALLTGWNRTTVSGYIYEKYPELMTHKPYVMLWEQASKTSWVS